MEKVIASAGLLLPHQPILENFVHHNPHEVLQAMPFHQALAHVAECDARMSPGDRRLYALTGADPRPRANDAVSELAAWAAPGRDRGFLHFFASREGSDNLRFFGAAPEDWEGLVQSMLHDLPGWAGMFQRMEAQPCEAPCGVTVRLADFVAVHTVLHRASVEAMARGAGWRAPQPLSSFLAAAPTTRDAPRPMPILLQANEAAYERATLAAIGTAARGPEPAPARPGMHPEAETYGVPGFFHLAIRYQAADK
eukprot:gene25177-45108_t